MEDKDVQVLSTKIEGLGQLVKAESRTTQLQLDRLSNLPEQVTRLAERQSQISKVLDAHERQFEKIEAEQEHRRDLWVGPRTANLIGIMGVIVAAVAILVSTHG